MRDGVSVRGRVGALAEFRTSRWVVPCGALIAFAPIVLVCALQAPMYPMSPDEQMQALYASGRYLASGPNWLMPYSLARSASRFPCCTACFRSSPGIR